MMTNFISILTGLFLSTVGIAQPDSIRGNEFELKGKMISEVAFTPHCGIIAFATVIEFEIVEFSNIAYNHNKIGVIFTCPGFYSSNFFEPGKEYSLTIADENQADFGWTILNESLLTKYKFDKKFWVIDAEKIE